MFMVSFVFGIVYFEWKSICAGLFLLSVYALPLENQLSIGKTWDPINWFDAAICLFLSQKPGPGFPKSYVMVCFVFRELPLLLKISFHCEFLDDPIKVILKTHQAH